jgi:hypothetical protein
MARSTGAQKAGVRLGHLLAELLLLGPHRLEPGDRGAAGLVGGEQRVNDVLRLAASALAGAQEVRIFAQEPEVNHEA